jgi:SAM-dependent methyltransferase
MAEPVILNDVASAKAARREEIERVRLIERPAYGDTANDWPEALLVRIQAHETVLDVGRSTRDWFEPIKAKARSVQTLDLNVWQGYPDLVADLCQPIPEVHHGTYDVVIALAVLECVYDPQAMIDNIFRLLKPGGRTHLYAPFIYQYHAPRDLTFQDNYRFSRDGLSYLLRGFGDVEMQAVRGQYSTVANLLPSWKVRVERRFGGRINRWLDRIAEPRRNLLDASGYNVTAVKPITP